MKAPNHIAGGIVLTGFTASFSDINIFDASWKIPVIIFFALLPDIDLPQSIIGRLFYPIAKWLNKHYGHRTITHSLPFLAGVWLVSSILEYSMDLKHLTFLATMACFSHNLFDMMTLQGVPFMYPFSKIAFVLPSNPQYRLSNQNNRAEIIVFCLFTISGFGLQPLLKNGFWNTYNTHFGTIKHLQSEFLKHPDLIAVKLKYRTGSEKKEYQGYCISPQPLICINRDGFFQPNEFDILEHITPKRTDFKYTFKTIRTQDIDQDSINTLLKGYVVKADIQGDKSYTFQYQRGRVACPQQYKELNNFIPIAYHENKIRIRQIRQEAQNTIKQNEALEKQKTELETIATTGTDIERQQAFEQLQTLPKPQSIDTSQLELYHVKQKRLYEQAKQEYHNQPGCTYQATLTLFEPEDPNLFYALDSIFDNWNTDRTAGLYSQ